MDRTKREQVREALRELSTRLGSQRKAGVQVGISTTSVSDILRGKDENISDGMWTRLSAILLQNEKRTGGDAPEWQEVATRPYQEIHFVLEDARLTSGCTWVVADAGAGKSTTARHYARTAEGALYVLCGEDMRRGDFLDACLKSVGVKSEGQSLRSKLDDLIEALWRMDKPVLILDEADKLLDSILLYCVTLYNRLEGHCGIVMLSTDYIKKRMRSGLLCNKRGYNELHSRIGRKFFEVEKTSATDIAAICEANQLFNQKEIDRVIRDAEAYNYDLRRVKKSILKLRK